MSMTAIILGVLGRRATAARIASRAATPAGDDAVTMSVVGRSVAPAVVRASNASRSPPAPTQAGTRTVASLKVEATNLRAGRCYLNGGEVKRS
jgi:hypothetical protein